MCHHTLQSSPARDGCGSSGNALQALRGAHAEVQVLSSSRQPARQETVTLAPLSRQVWPWSGALKHQMWVGMVEEPVSLSLGLESVPGVLHMASCFPRQGKAGVCGRAIHIEGSGEGMGRMLWLCS